MTVLFLPWLLVLLLVVAVWFAVRRWWKTAGILVLTALLLNWWGACRSNELPCDSE